MNWPKVDCVKVHWEKCRNWKKSVAYCSKVDTRVDGPWSNMKNFKFKKAVKDPMDGKIWYKWELELMEILNNEPDDRNVFWYWSTEGKTGKSSFCKHLVLKHNAIIVGGKASDAHFGIMNRIEKGLDCKIVVFNISRASGKKLSYVGIESIKNGMFFSAKYESGMVVFDIPHVVVFANYEPMFEKLSMDRWKVVNIDK